MLALYAALLLAAPAGAVEIGAAEKVVRNVYGTSVTKRMTNGEPLVANQKVATEAESAARLTLKDSSNLSLGPRAEVILDEFVYNPAKNFAAGTIKVAKGLMRFAGAKARLDLKVKTPTATIGIRGTIFDVNVDGEGTEVTVREGSVEVETPRGTRRVRAGQSIRVPPSGQPQLGQASPEMEKAVGAMLAMLPASKVAAKTSPKSAPKAGKSAGKDKAMAVPAAVRRDKDLESVLLIAVDGGVVAVRLRDDLAPDHVAWLKQMVRANFYDGIGFHSVAPGFAAETGDPSGTGNGGDAKAMDPEFSEESFKRGSVGMKASPRDPKTATSQFFILMKPAPHLDGKYTYIGDVIHGIERVDRLSPGQPPKVPSRIRSMAVAADVVR